MAKKPMPLENLPEYLKSNKEHGSTTGSPVLQMGQIVTTEKSNWLQRVALAAMLLMAISVGSFVTYDAVATKQMTVVVDIDGGVNSSEMLSKIVADNGGEVLAVTQREGMTYEVKLKTRKSRTSLLEWFRKNKDVKKAELEE